MTFYRTSDGKFYKASGLKGGGLIRHVDKPYSELREGDFGYDVELLDIEDDSPLLEDMIPSLSEDLYPTAEENVQSIYKNTRVVMLQQARQKLYYAGGQLVRSLKILLSLKQQEVWRAPILVYCLSLKKQPGSRFGVEELHLNIQQNLVLQTASAGGIILLSLR